MQGSGVGIYGARVGSEGIFPVGGVRVWGSGVMVQGLGFRVWSFRFRGWV